MAKPFVKWAGGKGQLLGELERRLPSEILQDKIIDRYVEPFVDGGALFFYLKNKYDLRESYLLDNNHDLILTYEVIKTNCNELIGELSEIEDSHLQKSEDKRKENYYKIREAYNHQNIDYQKFSSEWIKRAGYFIFLNKNSKASFTKPMLNKNIFLGFFFI